MNDKSNHKYKIPAKRRELHKSINPPREGQAKTISKLAVYDNFTPLFVWDVKAERRVNITECEYLTTNGERDVRWSYFYDRGH